MALRGQLVARAYRAGTSAAAVIPPKFGAAGAELIGKIAAPSPSDRRIIVRRNLRRALGDSVSDRDMENLVEAAFGSYVRYYYDSFRLPSMPMDQVRDGFTVEGIEHLEAAMEHDGVGPVLALPHLGGWEWAAYWITQIRGWKLAAVVEKLEPPELFEWFLQFRRSLGINVIPLGPTAAEDVALAAANKEIVCLLCDRDLVGGGPEVSFFDERTTLPAGPAVMALRGGCAVLPTAVYFTEAGVHGVVRPPIEFVRSDPNSIRPDVAPFMQKVATELEGLIRRAPEQWHLMQPNWPSDHDALRSENRAPSAP